MLKGFENIGDKKRFNSPMPGLKQMEVLEMIIGEILLKTGTGEEVEGVVAELNTWMQIAALTYATNDDIKLLFLPLIYTTWFYQILSTFMIIV